MPELIDGKQIFSLLEVTKSIQKSIAQRYTSAYWIKAEMNKLNYYSHSGHCYPDIVEKINGKVIAQMRANLWRDDFQSINANFQKVLKEPLKEGIKILFLANISFHPEYGMSLRILDIDPNFTLGDLEREKQEAIQKLKEEGIYSRNKSLQMPRLPQRIAIISVESSKGYADFLQVFDAAERQWKYKFFYYLFPSLLQGDNAVRNIIRQLRRIKKVKHHFDVVAIIRGGGGDIGLSCYNNYELAREIALFPIPVLSGIGHSTNETVVEMVSFENAITPTKLAEFLIQKFHNFSVPVQNAQEILSDKSKRLIREESTKFLSEIKLLKSVSRNILQYNYNELQQEAQSLFQHLRYHIKSENVMLKTVGARLQKGINQSVETEKKSLSQVGTEIRRNVPAFLKQSGIALKNSEQNLKNLSPENILKRGYSITLLNGKSLTSSSHLNEGQEIKTILHQGSVTSVVKSSNNETGNE